MKKINNIKSGKSELKKFGITVGIVFALFALFFWWNGKNFFYFIVSSAIFLFSGLFLPIFLKPVHVVWMAISLALGYVMTRIILCVLFYLILTPLAVISRLIGKRFLDLNIEKSKESYWNYRIIKEFSKESYEKQF